MNRSGSQVEIPYYVEPSDEGKWWQISKVYGDTISPVPEMKRLCAKCRFLADGKWQDFQVTEIETKHAANEWAAIHGEAAVGMCLQKADEVEVDMAYRQDGQLKYSTLTWNGAGK